MGCVPSARLGSGIPSIFEGIIAHSLSVVKYSLLARWVHGPLHRLTEG